MNLIRKVKIPAIYVRKPYAENVTEPKPSAIDPSNLLRVCTILYQQQNATDRKVFSNLRNANFPLTHESFLQVCNRFLFSWKPVYRFFRFSVSESKFAHSPITHNKILDIYGKSHNVELLWEFLQETAEKKLVTVTTLHVAARWLAVAKEMKKCVEMFRFLENPHCYDSYSIEILNSVVECLCHRKLVPEARYLVSKLRDRIEPDEITYGFLIDGFCEIGDLVGACKVWNRMVEEGLEPNVASSEKIIEAFFKCDRISDAMQMFRSVKMERFHDVDLSLYRLLITWFCTKGKLDEAYMVFNEMLKRGISVEPPIYTLHCPFHDMVCMIFMI